VRKGKISLERDNNDGLLHFKWSERNSDHAEDDMIVFPGDIAFKRVTTPNAADRIYLLKISSSRSRKMFWMQVRLGLCPFS
jgi:hypothetical protein